MPANNTNQSMLSGYTRPQYDNPANNQRAQAYTRNQSPNTPYNQGSNDMQNQFFGYSPSGYGGQEASLGRYVPPMMQSRNGNPFGDPTSWYNSGGYAYNTPQAYTGGYGNQGMQQSASNPGSFGSQFGGGGFLQFLQQMMQQNRQPQGAGGMDPTRGGGFGAMPAGPPADAEITPNRGGGFGPMPERMNMHEDRFGPNAFGGHNFGMTGQTPIPSRSNNVNSFGQYLTENSLGGGQRAPAAPQPVDTWSGGGVQPQQPNRSNMGFIDPEMGRQRAPRAWGAGLPGGFGGG